MLLSNPFQRGPEDMFGIYPIWMPFRYLAPRRNSIPVQNS